MLRRIGDEVAEHPKPGGWGALIAAKLVCCGGLLLFATGYLTISGIGAWLHGGGAMGLGLAVPAIALLILWRRRKTDNAPSDGRPGAVDNHPAPGSIEEDITAIDLRRLTKQR